MKERSESKVTFEIIGLGDWAECQMEKGDVGISQLGSGGFKPGECSTSVSFVREGNIFLHFYPQLLSYKPDN